MKFESSRLKDYNYKIDITLEEARNNGEIIRQGNSQLLDTLRRVKGIEFDPYELEQLELELKRVKKRKNSYENAKQIREIENRIDEILFVPEIISIKFDNKTHLRKIVEDGLYINNNKFVRLLAGAGNLRRNTVVFIDDKYFEPVKQILDNGRNKNIKQNPAKLSAYFGLYNSSAIDVSTPNFVVIDDLEITRNAKLNWINDDDSINTVEKEIDLNCFDGQGLISPRMSQRWADDLELSHTPSTFIFRSSYMKGQLATFDFHELAKENGIKYIKDIYGDEWRVDSIDVIISKSQFKLWNAYDDMQNYLDNVRENDLKWWVTRVSPSFDNMKRETGTNYMFLQVLSLSDKDIELLCKDTLDYFNDLLGGDYRKMILYLGGSVFETGKIDNWEDRTDAITRALIINPELANDPYIKDYFRNSINKKITDSYMGKLYVEGNYIPLVADPYAQGMFALELDGTLLDEFEHYSKFWSSKRVDSVACARSPLTHNSEMMAVDLVNREEHKKWYKYQDTSMILPTMGLDVLYMAD